MLGQRRIGVLGAAHPPRLLSTVADRFHRSHRPIHIFQRAKNQVHSNVYDPIAVDGIFDNDLDSSAPALCEWSTGESTRRERVRYAVIVWDVCVLIYVPSFVAVACGSNT